MLSKNDVAKIWLSDDAVWLETVDGRRAAEYFADYRNLRTASPGQLAAYRLSFYGIHWPELDEDLSFDGFLAHSKKAVYSKLY